MQSMDQPYDLEEEQKMIEANITEFMKTARQYLLDLMPVSPHTIAQQSCKGC
jgi:hypothetical protein